MKSSSRNPNDPVPARLKTAGWCAALFLLALSILAGSCSGMAAPAQGPGDFTFVIFPDTQYMVSSDLAGSQEVPMWRSMCQWVVDNRKAHNIQAVLSVGDITDHASADEFRVASEGFAMIDAVGIPYVPIVGNHDYDLLFESVRGVRRVLRTGPVFAEALVWRKSE